MQTVHFDDQRLQRFQDNVSNALRPLSAEIVNGRLVKGVVITAANGATVNHGLGRALLGWFPVRMRANAVLWDGQDQNSTPERTLVLHASADVTADFWVF